ncbi:MAG: HDOD domain-containing protein [Pseudomonadota bacterium]
MTELTRQAAEKLVESIGIPPRPAVVLAVMDEKAKDEPDQKVVADAIARDVGLSAALLKTVNSPLFGLRRQVQSIPLAVGMLGIPRVATVVNCLALKASLNAQGIERFWDQSARTGLLCAWLAGKMGHDRDAAHLFGLFRDAGLPLLMKRFPDYRDTLRLANQDPRGFTAVENERHGMDHSMVGAILARNWCLPEVIREAVRQHHEPDIFNRDTDHQVRTLVALSHLAGQMECRYSRHQDDGEWGRFERATTTWLMIDPDDLATLTQEAESLLLESGL